MIMAKSILNKPVLILQLRPEDITADSEYACFLKYGRLKAEDTCRIRIEKKGIPADIDLDDYSAIIVGGSPFDISTPEDKKSGIQKKIEADFNHLLEQVVTGDFPFLGACSGNGLLGNYLGTAVTTKYGEAVGCVTLDITDAGKKDKMLEGFPNQIDALLGHKEACDSTPAGSVLLVTGDNCPVQMFRVGENVYATQFHPEGDAEEFNLRIDTYANHGYFEPHEADALKKEVCKRPTPYAQEILRRFVECYLQQKGFNHEA
ncbi:MAG: glutamine amidotransferase [Gammaproteobacteria bacterium]|jgi:GMP synthase (glutamine-hydrolysing)|nr:glutamine amidotransferase [Gammaproteobacteria bacterium]